MSNEGEVYFGLFGDDFDPASLSIGIAPTRTRRKAMASTLVGALEPHADRVLEAKRAFGLEAVLEVVLTITRDQAKSTPAIGFDSRVIAFLHRIGASIDIDTYRGES
jgi:uncharacterized protein DUF4279